MKIGIVSDIHGRPAALRRVLDDMPAVDKIFCAGDAISEYRFCAETVALLQQVNAVCIKGNHECVLFDGGNPAYLEKCRAEHGAEILDVLASAPTTFEYEAAGSRVLMVHASPWEPYDEYITPNSRSLPRFAELPYNYVIMGHTHIPMVHQAGDVTVINPGSCSEPRERGDRRGCYAVLDLHNKDVNLHRVELDPL